MTKRRRRYPRKRSPWWRLLDVLTTVLLIGVLALVVDRFQRQAEVSLSGAVTVNDGDTLTLSGERIRLKGLDAPEFSQTCSRNGVTYSCGREARSMLRSLVSSGKVVCEGYERDRYERLLARCSVNGQDIGAALVEAGWAVAYGDYDREEAIARRARKGMWDGAFDAPRDWRARHGGLADEQSDGGLLQRLREFFRGLFWGRSEEST